MSKFENEDRTVRDALPASVVRELQVEQFWARRNVLADRMNEERINLYATRRALVAPDRLRSTDSSWCPAIDRQLQPRTS